MQQLSCSAGARGRLFRLRKSLLFHHLRLSWCHQGWDLRTGWHFGKCPSYQETPGWLGRFLAAALSCCSPVTQCLGASRRRALSEREEQVPVVPKPRPSFPVTPDTGAADSSPALELRPVFAGRFLVYSTFTISPGTISPAEARVIQGQLTPGLSGDGLGACRQPRAPSSNSPGWT